VAPPYLGRNGSLVAAAAIALSPVILYFTRFARHDGLMILWEFWIVVGLFRYIDSRNRAWLWLIATGIGLATTTHELYYIASDFCLFGLLECASPAKTSPNASSISRCSPSSHYRCSLRH
jgi:predicted membrane-bound mannosyltransferase